MLFVIMFVGSWIAYFVFGDKRRFHQLYATALIASALGLATDTLLLTTFHLWKYQGNLPTFVIRLLDDFGLYPVVALLYAQSLPSSVRKWFAYTLVWTLGTIALEAVAVGTKRMSYDHGWNLGWSYVADWVIFTLLTVHQIWSNRQFLRPHIHIDSNGNAQVTLSERCSAAWINRFPGVRVYRYVSSEGLETFLIFFEPGAVYPTFSHVGHEIHYVIDGSISVTVNGTTTEMDRGGIIDFAADTPHSFANRGRTVAIVLSVLMGNSYESYVDRLIARAVQSFQHESIPVGPVL